MRKFIDDSIMEFLDVRDFLILRVLRCFKYRLGTRRLIFNIIKPMCELCDLKSKCNHLDKEG